MMKKLLSILAVVGLLACQEQPDTNTTLPPLHTIQMTVGGITVEVEVAMSAQEQAQGLMYRESMPEDHGMLFVYSQPRYMSFWMKNTTIPLSIAYIREDGVIGNIEKMAPHTGDIDPSEHYTSRYKSKYALEMNQGWFEQNNIKEGDSIQIPSEKIQLLRNAR